MRRLLVAAFLAAACIALCGCVGESRRRVVGPTDGIPPSEPRDVYSVTGDGRLTLYWSPPDDPDVDGFAIFISRNDVDYWFVDEVHAWRRHFVVDGHVIPSSVPFEFVNGSTYWLGVTAIDRAGNESELSIGSTTFDTPRPSGRGLRLYDLHGPNANRSGYDFSRSPYGYAMAGADLFADVYFAVESGVPVMRTAHSQVVELYDAGNLDFDHPQVGWFWESDWQPQARVELYAGHVYLVRIWEESRPGNALEPFHVGKFQVVQLGFDSVVIDWAYQIAPNNPELKPQADRAASLQQRSSHELREVHR